LGFYYLHCPLILIDLEDYMPIRITTLLIFIISINFSWAQTGANPPSVKWQQINTKHFQVIFPEELTPEGQHLANTLEYIHGPLSGSLGRAPHKIPLILQNQGVISNGFVSWSPRRSEFFSTSPQDYNLLGTNSWLNLLSLHEFRHVVQYEQTYESRSKLAYYLFGQNGLSVAGFWAVPDWFKEGDAVVTETAYSPSGRGRIPDFNLLFRTTLLERKAYSYNKQHLGSFKDNVPNHYVTGYNLVTHGRRKYGSQLWGKVMHNALNNFYVPFTFSRALRRQTGKALVPFYKDMVHELDSLWTQQAAKQPVTPATVVTTRNNKVYTDYLYPQPLSDGSMVALKTGLAHIPTFVRLKSGGEEEKLFTPGSLNNGPSLSVVMDKIVWSEVEYDPRWTTRNYSVLKTYDIATKTYRVLKRRTRLSSPAFSPDAQTIAAIEVNLQNEAMLVLVEATTGAELKRISSPTADFLAMPRWAPDGKSILLMRTWENKRTIAQVDIATGTFTDLLPPTTENIAHPVLAQKYLYYNAPYQGIENIYALDLETKKQYQVVSRRYAGINPALLPEGDSILFNDFTIMGYQVAKAPNESQNWLPLENVPATDIAYYQPAVEQESQPNLLANVPNQKYPVARYQKLKNLINVHSWMPTVGSDVNEVSLAVLSQDILSTTTTSVGYSRNLNEKVGQAFASASYAGLFPVISLAASAGSRAVTRRDTLDFRWQEKSLTAGLSVPLNLTRSRYRQFLTLSARGSVTQVTDFNQKIRFEDQQANGIRQSLNYQVSYQRSLQRTRRDLASRFEQAGSLYYIHTPSGDYRSQLLAATGRLAFPGLARHHSFQVRGNYQHQNNDNYIFNSPLRFPRGYSYRTNDSFYGFTTQYALPIWYPDLALGPFLYFQRIKGNIFYDYGQSEYRKQVSPYRSLGLELSTDFNFMRLNILLDAGVRISYLPQSKKPVVELIITELGI